MPTETICIPARFNGPPGMGNGGITASLVARDLPQPSEVRLLAPVPLGRKVTSASAIYDAAGDLIASATTIWVQIGAQEGTA